MRISDWSSDVCSSDLQLPLNNDANSLHGGTKGFDKQLWTVASVESGPTASVPLTLTSPAGDQGYPGTLDVTVTYSLDRAGALTLDFDAKNASPTILNLTKHAIFNLAGEGAPRGTLDHQLTAAAGRYQPV